MLFMPASNARALEKARDLPCDGVIFDLEDAVAPDAKAVAREQAAAAVAARAYGARETVIRINGLDTPWWRDDLKAAVAAGPDAILLPKVEGGDVFHRIEEELAWLGPGANAGLKVWIMMETPLGFLNAREIVAASDRLDCVVIGTNDLVKDLRGRHTRERLPVITALGLALLAVRTKPGLTVLDGVYSNFRNVDGFRAEALQARDMGFDGKTLIHPAQIEAANSVFGADDGEIDEARRMIAAFDQAAAEGKGVAVLDGRMIEELHVAEARRLVAMAEAIAALAKG
ncbi:MAG: CoA ester lyase [Alphaproteobacteria bacterium]|nr:MAG: CoA ester lyase [Alphaproteobacteria bacterium]